MLLVEDDEAVRRLAGEALRRAGYRVAEASAGEAALEIVRNAARPIDLLITDVVLPGIHGGDLWREAELLRPELRVLFISGYPADVAANRGLLDPAVEFLAKPFKPAALVERVRAVLDEPDRVGDAVA